MKNIKAILLLSALAMVKAAPAISLDDIQLWTGSGTNRAALVIQWSVPESLTNSSVPVPLADKTLAWGYRFNGTNVHGSQMLSAILVADPKLYVVENNANGPVVEAIGYNLNASGLIGITDENGTNYITNGILTAATMNIDNARTINGGDLYWGGVNGPQWELWNETNDAGGFWSSPNRGTNAYWTATDTTNFATGYHGQWALAGTNLDNLPLTNGSWIGLSVAAGESESATNAPYNLHKRAPVSPDGTYVAYVCDTNDFAVQVVSSSNIYSSEVIGQTFYTNVLAVLGNPTLKFYDGAAGQTRQIHRTKIVEPAYYSLPDKVTPDTTEINAGGQITVSMERKIYHNPNNPYGIDFNIYGNSFYVVTAGSDKKTGEISDSTDEGSVLFSGSAGTYGHTTTVSVSQDGTNWYTYPYVPVITPDNAYRWDDGNHAWTDEPMNETKPLNPALNFPTGFTAANALDQYVGAYGGTGYNLQASGLPWIQYIRITAGTNLDDTYAGDYTVIDAIGAINPVVVGDALSITPANLVSGITNLNFQNPSDLNQTLISLNFDSVSTNARISTVSLHEFSAFAPVVGNVSSSYQLQARSFMDTNPVALQADIGLRVADNYSGNGSDLRVYQWNLTNWISQPFIFNPADNQVQVAGVTNFSAFVVSQITPPQISMQAVVSGGTDGGGITNGFAFQFKPVPNCAATLERSTDLVTWTPIHTFTATNAQPIQLHDLNVPADKAFYRVRLNP